MRPITRYPILLLLLTVLFLATGCSDDTHTLMKKAQAQLGRCTRLSFIWVRCIVEVV